MNAGGRRRGSSSSARDGPRRSGATKSRLGERPVPTDAELAHDSTELDCYTLPHLVGGELLRVPSEHEGQRAARRAPLRGRQQRNWTSYSFQTIRDDVFMLGHDGDVCADKIVPVRSACAVTVGSQNQQPRGRLLAAADRLGRRLLGDGVQPALRAHGPLDRDQRLLELSPLDRRRQRRARGPGAHARDARGRTSSGATSGSAKAARLRRRGRHRGGEPQSVIGSKLHELAWPEKFAAHEARGRELDERLPPRGESRRRSRGAARERRSL